MRSERHSDGIQRLFIVLAAIALALSAATALQLTASAQGPLIDFRVTKYTCETDPGEISPVADNAPADCTLTEGVTFTVEGDALDAALTCTTDASGQCVVQVPSEATVTVTEDTSTAPAGYAPRANPIETQAVTEFAGAVFVNLPVADGGNGDDGETPTDLPDTGTGAALAASQGTVGLLVTVATLMIISGALVRRPNER